MAVKTLPLDYDIVVYSGTSYRRQFRWLPDGAIPQDYTGWDAHMRIGLPGQPAAVQLSLNSGIALDSVTGQITIDLTPFQTDLLKPGIMYYNLDLTEASGFVRRFLRGRVSVILDIEPR